MCKPDWYPRDGTQLSSFTNKKRRTNIPNSIQMTWDNTKVAQRTRAIQIRCTLLAVENQHRPGGALAFRQIGSNYSSFITKTCLYNVDPLKPHFYIVNLSFQGYTLFFLISAQKHRLWVLIRAASLRRYKRVPTIYVLSRNMKNIRIFSKNFHFFYGEISSIFE